MAERERVRAALARHVPDGAGAPRSSSHCYYTSTPDFHFAIGPVPFAPNVILGAACSGHGFKFATALGESLADIAQGRTASLPMDVFNVARLS